MSEEQINRKKMEFQMLMQQISMVQSQLEAISSQVLELNMLVESLDEIEKTETGTEILIPLGAGIFTHANISNPKEVIMNVGSRVTVPKTTQEAKETVITQVKELEKIMVHLEGEFRSSNIKAQQFQQELQSLMEEKK